MAGISGYKLHAFAARKNIFGRNISRCVNENLLLTLQQDGFFQALVTSKHKSLGSERNQP